MKHTLGVVLCLFCLIACKAEPISDAEKVINPKAHESEVSIQEYSVAATSEKVLSNAPVKVEIAQENTASVPKQITKEVVPVVKEMVEKAKVKEVDPILEKVNIKPRSTIDESPTINDEELKEPVKSAEIIEEERRGVDPTPIEETVPLEVMVIVNIHEDWDKLLKRYVTPQGGVDYAGFKSSKAELESYLSKLDKNSPQKDWPKAKTMAYWINAYNAHTVHLIVSNYPLKSITDLDGGDPWKVKRISIGDKMYSLNNIEHDILRPDYKDPRIHFAVNCAAKSCPKIHNGAWTKENLETNLDELTKEFVNNKDANIIAKKEVSLSKIFDWYKSDFGDLISFLNKYSEVKIDNGASVKYQDYNWQLNSK